MAKFAVDIVLLPPVDIMDYAIGVNKELLKGNPAGIILDKGKCLPHISLSMGVLDEDELENAKKLLEEVAAKLPALRLSITGVTTTKHDKGGDISVLDVDGEGLQELHETIMKSFSSSLQQGIVENVQWIENREEEVKHIWKDWVKDFAKNSAFEKFEPHITVGLGRAEEPEKLRFTATRLAVCHLGDYCTCRKILAEAALKGGGS